MVKILVLSSFLLFQVGSPGVTPQSGVRLQDETVDQGQAIAINFEGTGISCAAVSGGIGTCTISGGSGYSTIQDEGTPLTQRSTVNFVGSAITCVDSGGITVCTLSGGGSGLDHAQVMSRVSLGF